MNGYYQNNTTGQLFAIRSAGKFQPANATRIKATRQLLVKAQCRAIPTLRVLEDGRLGNL